VGMTADYAQENIKGAVKERLNAGQPSESN
jgi:hypothetical protein